MGCCIGQTDLTLKLLKKIVFFSFSFPEYLDLVGLVSGHLLSSGNRDPS